ncbi:MAG TPA: DUF4260 domain-containing protein [Ferruginibacter sp.]|jgi:hypothetical protein|nr:DUF4260 domain-containing protein [Ferruginibacter sp.]
MKLLLKLEELAMFLVSIYALHYLQVSWWWYLITFFGPDISMIGYTAGNTVGAACYNLFHHKGIAIIVLMIGVFTSNWTVEVVGLVLFGHSSLDRFAGYGLKYNEGFKFTSLGKIGKEGEYN